MKRTIKHPDGRVEEQEGTAKELAEFDVAKLPVIVPTPAKESPLAPKDAPKQPTGTTGVPHWPDMWRQQFGGQGCLYEGLPPGAYMLSCPCPRHGTYC